MVSSEAAPRSVGQSAGEAAGEAGAGLCQTDQGSQKTRRALITHKRGKNRSDISLIN